MRIRHRPRTLGDLISTLCFAGMALWLAGEALLVAEAEAATGADTGWRSLVLAVSAGLCLLGALRHVIAALWARLAGRDGQ